MASNGPVERATDTGNHKRRAERTTRSQREVVRDVMPLAVSREGSRRRDEPKRTTAKNELGFQGDGLEELVEEPKNRPEESV